MHMVMNSYGQWGLFQAQIVATMYNSHFVIDDKLLTDNVTGADDFGKGVCVIDNTVFVGAPEDDGNVALANDGTVAIFDLTVSGEYAWKNIASETALVCALKVTSTLVNKKMRYFFNL